MQDRTPHPLRKIPCTGYFQNEPVAGSFGQAEPPMNTRTTLVPIVLLACLMRTAAQAQVPVPTEGAFKYSEWDPYLKAYTQGMEDPKPLAHRLLMPGILNTLMSKEVSKYLSSSGDLTYSNAFAVLDDSDDRLTLGYNWTNRTVRDAPFHERLKWVYSAGLKGNITKGFTEVWNEKGWQQDIGFYGKITWVGRGSVYYTSEGRYERQQQEIALTPKPRDDHKEVAERKEKYHRYALDKEAAGFVEAMEKARVGMGLDDQGMTAEANYGEELEKTYADKREKLQKELSEKMIDAVLDGKLYTWITGKWVSLETYLPVTETGYKVAATTTQGYFTERLSMPFSASLSGTAFARHPSAGTFQAKLSGRAWQNNSADAKLIEETPFQTLVGRGGTDSLYAVTENDDVLIGEFNRFASGSVALRGVWLYPTLFGLSAEVEWVLGDVNATNWKLGLPIHLQDKDGDGAVNIEVQWREQYKAHTIGLSVGIPIGKAVYE